MTLRYYLLRAPSQLKGIQDASAIGWVTMVDGVPTTTPPTWCDLISTTAYAVVGVYDNEGVVVTPDILAAGAWFIASIQDGEPPDLIEPRIVASWNAGQPVSLPEGVVQLSPILSGMV